MSTYRVDLCVDNIQGSNDSAQYRTHRHPCHHESVRVVEDRPEEFSFTDRATAKHGGPWYGGYVFLPHGHAWVQADSEDEAIDKALAGLQQLVNMDKNYAK